MAEYIERSAAIRALTLHDCDSAGAKIAIRDIPAADVSPVVHGRWIEGAENFTCGNHNAECSVCGANISWNGCDEDFNYCPNCGAKMDKEATDGLD